MKFDNTLMTLVSLDLDAGLIPMLLGEPGIGKSSWVEALGKLKHTKVFVLPCNQLADKADLTGARLIPTKDGKSYEQVFYPHSIISRAITYAEENPRETPILFMDELNRTTPDVTSEALSIPTQRAIGNAKLPENLRIITAGNDKGNVTSLDEASISRFVLYHVEPDTATFLSLDPDMNPFVKTTLQKHPECIFGKTIHYATTSGNNDDDDETEVDLDAIIGDDEEMLQIATPRTIMGVSRWLNAMNQSTLQALLNDVRSINGENISMLQEALEGHTGRTTFTTFLLEEIATNIMTMTTNTANTVSKPQVYDSLKTCQTVDQMTDMISNQLSDRDKSGCLVYALYEKEDNTRLINALLASDLKTLLADDAKELMKLYSTDSLDEQNKTVFLSSKSPIAQQYSVVMV